MFAKNKQIMSPNINIIKGIHPGLILGRELQRRLVEKLHFAHSIDELPQTIEAIIKGEKSINASLSLKIEQALGFEEGYFIVLQAYYDIKVEKLKQNLRPDISKLRTVLFWDTDINNINWIAYKKAVIQRVFERGNDDEKREITRFYSKPEIDKVLNVLKQNGYTIHHKAEKNEHKSIL
jgi:plasmid maintenance system antidote protein VapI